jgi:FkbM family methyltransferase
MLNDIIKKIRLYGPARASRYALVEIYRLFFFNLMRRSYSQKGEDLIMDSLLGNPKTGFYVDVGAHDPDRFSNTKRFYNKGWHGINVEPNTDLFSRFSKRTRDINLNCGIGAENFDQFIFHQFFPNTLSTFDAEVAKGYERQGFKCTAKKRVEVKSLAAMFDELVKDRTIDFLNIDVEGLEMEVLSGNDWKRFRPRLICIEAAKHDSDITDNGIKASRQHGYLTTLGYERVHFNGINAVYQDRQSTNAKGPHND